MLIYFLNINVSLPLKYKASVKLFHPDTLHVICVRKTTRQFISLILLINKNSPQMQSWEMAETETFLVFTGAINLKYVTVFLRAQY